MNRHCPSLIAMAGLALLIGPGVRGATNEPMKTTLISNARDDAPDASLLQYALRFENTRLLENGRSGHVTVLLRASDGVLAEQGVASADYNESSPNTARLAPGASLDAAGLRAELDVTIGPDGARRGRPAFPTPADRFQWRFSAAPVPGAVWEWVPDREAFMPPWRRDTPDYGGARWEGRYEGVWTWGEETHTVSGRVVGAVNPLPTATRWGVRGNGVVRAEPGGLALTAHLPPTRAAQGAVVYLERRWRAPQDWSGGDTLRLVIEADEDRRDVAIFVAVHGPNDQVHAVADAAFIRKGRHTWDLPMREFDTVWDSMDWRQVSNLRVGVSNRQGVGTVRFTLDRVDWLATGRAEPPVNAPVRVTLDPALVVALNDCDRMPDGLFGFHDVGHEEPRPPRAGLPDPETYMRELRPGLLRPLTHTSWAESVRPLRGEVEEPGEWLVRRAVAGGAAANVIWCHTSDLWDRPPWMDIGLEESARRVRAFYRALARQAWRPDGPATNLLRRFEVWNEPFMWGRNINMGFRQWPDVCPWDDPTQYGYIPGRLGAEAWATLFRAAVAGAREVNPHVELGGPSAPAFHYDDYGMLEHYLEPILAQVGDRLDFLTEHHYGGDPRAYAASYEVVTAWCDTRHGRRIPIYNTEANHLGASDAGLVRYNLLDILLSAQWTPDKLRGRALHACWNGYLRAEGEAQAYRLLAPLRGRRLAIASSDPAVIAAATRADDGRVVAVLFNGGERPRTVNLTLPADTAPDIAPEALALWPAGDEAETQVGDTEGAAVRRAGNRIRAAVVTPARDADGWRVELPANSALRLIWSALAPPARTEHWRQHFWDGTLVAVRPGETVEHAVRVRGATPAGARRARLRLVTQGVRAGGGQVLISGHALALPRSSADAGQGEVQELELDPAWIGKRPRLAFTAPADDPGGGYRILCASLLVCHD